MKVLCIFGTRPEAIKLAPVIAELRRHTGIGTRVCVTGQHREMLDHVLELFHIAPDLDLSVMTEDQTLSMLTARLLTSLDSVIGEEQPDWVIVQGDTTTAMVASLVAFYHRLRIGHVEAGLRTWNKYHPYPEEINRRIVGSVGDLHFAPTKRAAENLMREGVAPEGVLVTGNTVIDAQLSVLEQPLSAETGSLLDKLNARSFEAEMGGDPSSRNAAGNPRLLLVTAHRRENFGGPLLNICEAVAKIASERSDLRILFLVHLNPNVQKIVHTRLGGMLNVTLMSPVDYQAMTHLMKHSCLILTDSGGLQEEAPTFHVPVLVMRETTERPEAIEAGTARLVGTRTDDIVANVLLLLDDAAEYRAMSGAPNPFGDGRASERIVRALMARGDSAWRAEPDV